MNASTLSQFPPAPATKPTGRTSTRSPLIERMIAWRKSQGLTQKATAERLDISLDTLKAYECGNRNPGGPNTTKILALIGALK